MAITPEAAEAKPNLYQRLNAVMSEVGALEKTGKNTQLKFDFIEYSEVAARLRGLFARHGIVFLASMVAVEHREITIKNNYGERQLHTVEALMRFTLINADNPTERETQQWIGEAQALDDKTVSKAKTSAVKNFVIATLMLSDADDPDARSDESDERVQGASGKKPARSKGWNEGLGEAVKEEVAARSTFKDEAERAIAQAATQSEATPPSQLDVLLSEIDAAKTTAALTKIGAKIRALKEEGKLSDAERDHLAADYDVKARSLAKAG